MRIALVVLGAVVVLAAGSLAAWKLTDGKRRPSALTAIEGTTPLSLEAVDLGTRLTSVNGEFEVTVSDKGIVWNAPTGQINLTAAGVTLKSSSALSVQGSGTVAVQGTIVNLCGSGGKPIARLGDQTEALIIPAPPGPGVPRPGAIVQGSPTVLAC